MDIDLMQYDANLHTLMDEIKDAIGIFTPDEVGNTAKSTRGEGWSV